MSEEEGTWTPTKPQPKLAPTCYYEHYSHKIRHAGSQSVAEHADCVAVSRAMAAGQAPRVSLKYKLTCPPCPSGTNPGCSRALFFTQIRGGRGRGSPRVFQSSSDSICVYTSATGSSTFTLRKFHKTQPCVYTSASAAPRGAHVHTLRKFHKSAFTPRGVQRSYSSSRRSPAAS